MATAKSRDLVGRKPASKMLPTDRNRHKDDGMGKLAPHSKARSSVPKPQPQRRIEPKDWNKPSGGACERSCGIIHEEPCSTGDPLWASCIDDDQVFLILFPIPREPP